MSREPDITSVQNPKVKRVVRLRKPRERRAAGVLIAEGRREVERAFRAGLENDELFWCDALLGESGEGLIRGFASLSPRLKGEVVKGSSWCSVSADVLKKMAYHDKPEGVVGVFRSPAWTLDDIRIEDGGKGIVLVVVGSEKPGNLGAMVRTAAAAGCAGVLAVGPVVDLFNPNAIRNSTGAVFALPTVVVSETDEAVAWLKTRGVTIFAALAPLLDEGNGAGDGDASVSCFDAAWSYPAAVVVGPEHAGLDADWRRAADVAVTIPMVAGTAERPALVDSLNASTAAAVLIFEAARRRRGDKPGVNA